MFKWDKPTIAFTGSNPLYVFPESSGSRKVTPKRDTPYKRQKLMNNSTSSDDLSLSDDEVTNLGKINLGNLLKKDDSPPQVGIQHDRMIGGVKVKFPVEPYRCQMAVMNGVSAMIV